MDYIKRNEEYVETAYIKWQKQKITGSYYISCEEEKYPVICDKDDSDEEIVFKFKKLTYEYWKFIESEMIEKHKVKLMFGREDIISSYNFTKMSKHILQYVLKEWSLPIELVFNENGVIEDECYEKIMAIHPNILKYFIESFETSLFLSADDKDKMIRQSRSLFKDGNAVSSPHEAISAYCDLTAFWDKFGLNYYDLKNLPYELYLRLKTISQHEMTFKNIENKPAPKLSGKQVLSQTRF